MQDGPAKDNGDGTALKSNKIYLIREYYGNDMDICDYLT